MLIDKSDSFTPAASDNDSNQINVAIDQAIDAATTRRLARLAKIAMSDSEVSLFAAELNDIIGFVSQLKMVNVDNVAITPLVHSNRWRDDSVSENEPVENILSNSPSRLGNFFTVPKVIE